MNEVVDTAPVLEATNAWVEEDVEDVDLLWQGGFHVIDLSDDEVLRGVIQDQAIYRLAA